MIVPSRRSPRLADTRHATVPLPLPLVPDVIVIHDVLVDAVHAQPAGAVTLTGEPGPASSSTVSLFGEIEYVHGAAWVTVNVCPAIVNVPVRALPLCEATVNPTDPLPVPVAPDVTVIHDAALVAVHVQPAAVETTTGDPAPPAAAND